MHLSSVEGMHAFRRFLRGTMGEHIFSFWLDAERYRRQTKPQNRRYSFREIQGKYLKGGSPFELTELMKWKSLCGGLNIGQDGKSFSAPIEITKRLCQPNISVFSANIFVPLQKIILEQLGSYWAPKFVVHREKIRMRHKDHRGKVIHASHIYRQKLAHSDTLVICLNTSLLLREAMGIAVIPAQVKFLRGAILMRARFFLLLIIGLLQLLEEF